jgi:tartrate-resistant acid phosphatase type 5
MLRQPSKTPARSIWLQLVLVISALAAVRVSAAVDLLAFGDWGFDIPDRQEVADTMAHYVTTLPQKPVATLLLGDNFRVKLKDADDPLIQKLFEQTYDTKVLNFPFYAALGNHDYEQNKASIELSYAAHHPGTRWHMPAKWYRLDLPQDKPLVTVLMLDSNQQALSADEWASERQWIEQQLLLPRAPWTLCAAHHTMFSNGNHGDNGVLQTEWGTLFKKYHVDFYVCGHDHTLQHLEIDGWPISFVIAGGGGAGRKPMLRDTRGPFSKSQLGFAHLHFEPAKATVRFIDGASGQIVHAFDRDRSGKVATLSNSTSDRATTKPLRVIQGIE